MVGNACFIDSTPLPGYLRRDLWFETKTVLHQVDRLDGVSFKELITGLHVRQVQVGEHIGQERQKLITHVMPKVEDPVRSSTHKTGTEHCIVKYGLFK